MPIIEDDNRQTALTKSIGIDGFVDNEFTAGEALDAAFRLENSISSLIVKESGLPDSMVFDENFNPFEHLTEQEKVDQDFVDRIIYADSVPEIEAVRKQTAREIKDRNILANSGAMGVVNSIIAGTVDPINFIPIGGAAHRTYRTGGNILEGALATGTAASLSVSAQEMALHATQLERTYGESAANITGGALLGGVLGSIPGLIRTVRDRNPKIVDEIEDSMNPEEKLARGEDSVGAEAVFQDAVVKGKVAQVLTKVLSFDPLSRTLTSPDEIVRSVSSRLAESPIAFEKGIRQAVETKIKSHDGKYYLALKNHIKQYEAYRRAGGAMKRKEFNNAVSSHVRNETSTVDEIIKAAEGWNTHLYEPMKQMAIDTRLLPDDVDVTTAKNYLNRLWNKEKLRSNLDEFVSVTAKWLRETNQGKDPDFDFDELAREIATRITGTPDGRLPYDYKIGENSAKSGKVGLKGPLRERSFNIPDELIEQFLENDIELLGSRYLKNTAPDIEIIREFGDVQMETAVKEISESWDKKIQEASKTDPKKARKLGNKKDRDIKDLTAMRDRIRGTFGFIDPDNFWVRAGRVSRDLNFLRLMGGVTASSIPDAARVIMSEGIVGTFRDGLAPLVKNIKAFKLSAEEGRLYGAATDTLFGGRSEILADIADYSQGGTAFERAVRTGADKFSKVNLMNFWTTGVKQLHLVTMQTRVIKTLRAGQYDKRLGQLGIDEADAAGIGRELKKHAELIDGVWVANTQKWDSQALADTYGGALRKESDRVIVTPGQEKPLFMSKEMGKVFFQFRSFMFSSTQRMMIAGIQGQDAHLFQGLVGLTALGAMSYTFKQWDAGREISDDPRVWVIEGLDRSGALGIIMEANNTIEKLSRNNIGFRRLMGVAPPASRFASRSAAETMLGPTFGAGLDTTVRVLGAASGDQEWLDSDTRALRRLMPYQNLTLIRQLFDKLEEAVK